ncbi:hypothetical protein WOLCODRAFT_81797 [Wolfiporia cocos MD-104 SS10]|uniref:DUF6534 domain-containing protein n=1 Tax=Wolfiporia cocos (strain MD-104) TaxID=742152 RepID=A0A2H3J9H0_WOLCO|nr:hypothetical protein WOLCODRAFT_81797 [Wolfiporia cocos MD-104 SS10]
MPGYERHLATNDCSHSTLAYGMLIFEWVQTGLLTAGGMEIYVYNYGDLLSLVQFHNAWFALTIMCGIVSATVQTFFAWRIHRLSKSRILASCIIVVFGLFSTCCVNSVQVWLAGSAAADMLIAVSMVVLLLRRKSGIARTDALINRMVRLVVETGSLTGMSLPLLLRFCG